MFSWLIIEWLDHDYGYVDGSGLMNNCFKVVKHPATHSRGLYLNTEEDVEH